VDTVGFAYRGVSYRIDLSAEAVADFDTAVAGFIESAEKVGKRSVSPVRRVAAVSRRQSREQTAEVREWARNNGRHVSDQGRIPLEVLKAFDDAHRSLAAVG
jgi:Lsr2